MSSVVNETEEIMKKIRLRILCACMIMFIAGCGKADTNQTNNASNDESRYIDVNNLKQAGLGGLVILYDDSVWTYDETLGNDSSLAFTAPDDSLLGITCSRESYYQHPLDMISISGQLNSVYGNFEEVEEPTVVSVQDEDWYEWIYKYKENGVETIVLQRFFGKNYYAYTMSYVAEAKAFESNKNEALKVMNSAMVDVPDNTEAEEKAKDFLVGEWDLGASGYLVMNDDYTYAWYMDSSKDEKNMHRGTYSGDVSNDTLGFAEGEGVYFVLFPEVLYVDGEAGKTTNAKYDYAVSLEQQSDGTYPLINVSTFAMYSMMKQK